MALDDATVSFLQNMAAATPPGTPPMWEMTPAQARGVIAGLRELYGPGPHLHRVADHHLQGHDGGAFRVRVLTPVESPSAVVVYLHGGGWVLDDIDGYDTLGRILAQRSGAAVVLVEYRKAPEHPFPTPLEDSWTGLEWAAAQVEEIAGRRVPLWVMGDSAGGSLAAVLTQRARERGGPEIAGQVLVYPVTDADLDRPSYLEPQNQVVLTRELMGWFWQHYLPDAEARTRPDASPLRADSLAGLPPALVITAEHDVLRDEGEAYAQRLADDGVHVVQHRWPGQMHTFFSLINVLPASSEAVNLVAEYLRARTGGRWQAARVGSSAGHQGARGPVATRFHASRPTPPGAGSILETVVGP